MPLDGYTHTARTKSEGIDDVAYFSHPFEFDLYYKNDEINPKYKGIQTLVISRQSCKHLKLNDLYLTIH